VAHNDSSKIEVRIDGFMTAEAARAAALEVFARFATVDLGK
jgi:hypothetical protein